MKHFLMNLLGELPILLILTACYIIMDRAMFGNRLSGLIREGWRSKMRRLFIRSVRVLVALNPADPRKILDTVPWNEGLAGRAGELSAESEEDGAGSDSFDAARENNDGVVPREEYDRVFADSRLEVVPTANDNEEWIEPVSRDELDVGGTYDYPDDYDETGDAEYDEMNAAFGYIAGREQTARERDLAQRTIRNLKGTPALAELEATTERIKKKIRTVVKEAFADVRTEDRPVGGFDMGGYM